MRLYSKLELKSKFYSHYLGGGGRHVCYIHQVYMKNSLKIKESRVRFHLWNVVSMVWKCPVMYSYLGLREVNAVP